MLFAQGQDATRLLREDDPAYKKEREEWIRGMHRAEPGLNTDLVDGIARQAKAEYKMSLLRSQTPQGFEKDTLAGGRVLGAWSERGANNVAGRMEACDVDWDKNIIYAANSYGNIWKGSLSGNDWVSLNDGWRFGDVKMIRVVPRIGGKRIIVVANGPSAVYYSDNEGATWQKAKGLDGPASWGSFRKGIVSFLGDTVHVLGIEWDYKAWKPVSTLYISTDEGATFKNIIKGDFSSDRFDIWRSRFSRTPVYIIKADTIGTLGADGTIAYLSTTPDSATEGYFTLKGSTLKDSIHLVFFNIKHDSIFIYASDTKIESWKNTGYYPNGPFDWNNSLAVSENDPLRIYVGTVNTMRTSDGGASWDTVNIWWQYYGDPLNKLHADIDGIDVIHSLEGAEQTFVFTDGGLYISSNGLDDVENLTMEHIGTSQYYSTLTSSGSPAFIYAGSQDQGFQKSQDTLKGTLGFRQSISGDYGHLTSSNGGKTVWCNYPGFSMVYPAADSNDHQRAWGFKPGSRLWIPPIVSDPEDAFRAYVASGSGNKSILWDLHYDEKGDSVGAAPLPYDFSGGNRNWYISAFAISDTEHEHRYVLTTDGRFFHSEDSGKSWIKSDSTAMPGSHYFYGNTILPSRLHPGELYVAGSGYSNAPVFHSVDHGATFTPADSGLPHTLVYGIAQSDDEQFLFAGTDQGPYIYSKEAGHWFDMAAFSAPDHVYWTVEYVPASKTVRFGTYGRGIWDFAIEKMVNAVKSADISVPSLSLSSEYALDNASIKLHFSLPDVANATLRVYDETGKIINELCNARLSQAEHLYAWDFTTRGGTKTAPGFYIAVLSALGKTEFTKIVVK
jgi:hypothetical protein